MRAAFVALAMASCACRSPAPVDVLVLGTAHEPAFALVFIAEAKGFFADERLRVDQRRFPSGRDALDALLRGEVDAATAFDTPIVLRAAKVPDLEVLTTLHVSRGYIRVIARRDRGIASEADLRGKRVGAARGTSAEYLLHHILRLGGVPAKDVAVVDLGPEAVVDALLSGHVDAIATWPPYSEQAIEKLGPAGTVEMSSDAFTNASMLVTRSGVRRSRTDVLVRFVRALSRAEGLAQSQPEEALAALRGEFPDLAPDELRRQWDRQTLQIGLSGLLAQILASELEWFDLGHLGSGRRDVQRLLVPDVLARVADEAVTFVPAAASTAAR